MQSPNAVSALKSKRGEIAGRVDALQDQLRQALIDLDHVDCTILLFDPDAELDEIKTKPMPPRHHAFKGQVTRSILTMLRKSSAALDGLTITLRLMEERELNQSDKKLVKTIQKRVGAALRNLRDRELVASNEPVKGGLLQWSLAQGVDVGS
ncbi:hypothetical protein GRI55_05440 [Erythrobacter citreus]|uniref:Uncharacterized protein n=1 Tax=Qipengyuania citrea TaxID=225971 RepID=A0A6I4UD79_9SPHN|nr:hypothetical protein [Qipengyuania citrea]MDQ0566867.1 hypothetical protein [Qipengyuania citrea]MXP35213.1 hypothetical protein [Qipengyuania citrea]